MKPEAPTSRSTLHGWSDYGAHIVRLRDKRAGTRTSGSGRDSPPRCQTPTLLAMGARGFLS